ncbi:relaxase MobL [Staphylococcus epidermidis]|nr:relaxase MobL [Staphylococcus epidermidis]MCG1591640.1 relaxase MobL [Staphylococcus epidermidis]MCG2478631.1 relaxase MobL [Staphylococcus epidermidis]
MAPSIILKSQFNLSKFRGYLDYINDDKKQRKIVKENRIKELSDSFSEINNESHSNFKSFSKYIIGYMKNNKINKDKSLNKKVVKKRTTTPFNNKENLDEEDIKKLKEEFDIAETRGCINYQDIISFDNDFLIENNLYNPETDELNEPFIKKATQNMINKMIKDEKMNPYHTKWMASIHYDTDNIHIHISTTEMYNTRKVFVNENDKKEIKGKRSQKTLDAMKSSFSNTLLSSSKYLEQITLKRNELYHSLNFQNSDLETLKKLRLLKSKLPSDKKYWQYNNKKVKFLQSDIDDVTKDLLINYNLNEYKEYKLAVGKVAEYYLKVYGDNSRASDYIKNKERELNQRLGNKVLKELKTSNLKSNNKKNSKSTRNRGINFDKKKIKRPYKPEVVSRNDLYRIEQVISNETKEFYNELAYEKLMNKIEYENNN